MSDLSDVLRIQPDDTAGRFDRFELIGWWDQDRLATAKVIVVGAGALGNEIVKNLALLGVGHVLILDLDRIEHSNLSRSVLYRAEHAGRFKAEVAAEAASGIYPDLDARGVVGDVRLDLGLGAFRRADLVLGGLDNREARLAINRACYRVGVPWIDGAIERLDGVAKVFAPPGPCYECTMSGKDWDVLRHRRSCAGLSRTEMEGGRTPTTPTVSSIVAGVQVQEAVKLLHNLPTLSGRGWTFNGEMTEAWQIEYPRNPDCLSHDPLTEIVPLDATAADTTFGEILDLAGAEKLKLPKTLLLGFDCPKCGSSEAVDDLLERITADRLDCPGCGAARLTRTIDSVDHDSPIVSRTPAAVGFPPLEIFADKAGIGYELAGDAVAVWGEGEDDSGLDFDEDGPL
jgi:adenylyltransferase/sulfurtransferase